MCRPGVTLGEDPSRGVCVWRLAGWLASWLAAWLPTCLACVFAQFNNPQLNKDGWSCVLERWAGWLAGSLAGFTGWLGCLHFFARCFLSTVSSKMDAPMDARILRRRALGWLGWLAWCLAGWAGWLAGLARAIEKLSERLEVAAALPRQEPNELSFNAVAHLDLSAKQAQLALVLAFGNPR